MHTNKHERETEPNRQATRSHAPQKQCRDEPRHSTLEACATRVEIGSISHDSIDSRGTNQEQSAYALRITHSMNASKSIAYCSLSVLVALYIVGAVSNGSLRHEVQTLPLWFPIVLGFRQRTPAKWSALPCFIFWLAIMIFIWLFLLGWARIVTGHYSPTEIAMTLVIGVACLAGIFVSFRWRTAVPSLKAWGVAALFAALQLLVFRLSLIRYIATR
jgi:hypothetical protein